ARCGGIAAVQYIRQFSGGRSVKLLGLTYIRTRNGLLEFLRRGVQAIMIKDGLTPQAGGERVDTLLTTDPASAPSTAGAAETPKAAVAPQVLLPEIVGDAPPDAPPPQPVEPEQLRDLLPKMSQAKALRPVVHQVMAMAGNPNVDVKDITNMVRNDVEFSAK